MRRDLDFSQHVKREKREVRNYRGNRAELRLSVLFYPDNSIGAKTYKASKCE